MEHAQKLIQDAADQASKVGYVLDTALAGSAVAAWLLEIEQIIGAVGAGLIFLLALGTAVYRFLYWRAQARRAELEFNRDQSE